MGDLGGAAEVGQLHHRVGRGLHEEQLRVRPDRLLDQLGLGRVHVAELELIPGQDLVEQPEGAPVGVGGHHDVVARLQQRRDRADRRHARGEREPGLAVLDGGDVPFERKPRRVLGPRVLVALVPAELVLDVGRGLEQRRDDGAGRRIGLLARVNADGREVGGVGELHNRRCYHSARSPHAALPTPRSTENESRHAPGAAWLRSATRRSHAVTARSAAHHLARPALSRRRRVEARRGSAAERHRPARRAGDRQQRGDDRADPLGRVLRVAAVPAAQAPAAVAGPAQADPLLHLHRGGPGAADHRVLHPWRVGGLDQRQRVPVPRRLRRHRQPRRARGQRRGRGDRRGIPHGTARPWPGCSATASSASRRYRRALDRLRADRRRRRRRRCGPASGATPPPPDRMPDVARRRPRGIHRDGRATTRRIAAATRS